MVSSQFDTELKSDETSHISLSGTKVDTRHPEVDLQGQLLIITILLSNHWIGSLHQLGVDWEIVGSKVLNHESGIYLMLEPSLTLHSLHEAVWHSIRDDELEILALVVILEVVVVLIVRHQAVASFGTNVEEESEVKLMVVNLGISCKAPIDIEFT